MIRDLVAWGYLEVIERGKTEHGRFRTHLYKILYDEPGQGDDTPGGDSGVVIPGGELTTSPPEGAESDLPSSDKYWRSDSASDADFAQLSSKQCSEGNEVPDRSGDRSSAGHQYYRLRRSASLCNTAIDLKVATANDQASKLERSGERAIRKRLLDALLSAFPGALSGPALETVSTKAFNKSILLEKDKPGSGIASLIESVEKSLRKIRRA